MDLRENRRHPSTNCHSPCTVTGSSYTRGPAVAGHRARPEPRTFALGLRPIERCANQAVLIVWFVIVDGPRPVLARTTPSRFTHWRWVAPPGDPDDKSRRPRTCGIS